MVCLVVTDFLDRLSVMITHLVKTASDDSVDDDDDDDTGSPLNCFQVITHGWKEVGDVQVELYGKLTQNS